MAAVYPTLAATFPTRNDGTPFMASYLNALQDEVTALEQSLTSSVLPNPLRIGGPRPELQLDNGGGSKARMHATPYNFWVSQNLGSPDSGTNWYLDDPAQAGVHLNLAQGQMAINNAPAGGGLGTPRTLQSLFIVQADGSVRQGARSPMGEWTNVPYSAANFAAASGTWTVPQANIAVYAYVLIGRTCLVNFVANVTTTSASTGYIFMNLPVTANVAVQGTYVLNNGSTWAPAFFGIGAGAAQIILYPSITAGGAIPASAGIYVRFQIAYSF
jgi:hypothetical protein